MAQAAHDHRQVEITHALIDQLLRSERALTLREYLLRRYPDATQDQLDDALQEACANATVQWRGTTMRQLYRWLMVVADHALADLFRRSRREVPTEEVDGAGSTLTAATYEDPQDALFRSEDAAEINAAATAVVARLSERQQAIVALHSRGRKRPQIAEHLGLTERTVKRQLERIFGVARDELVVLAGSGCEQGRRGVARLAFGLGTPRELRDAQLHLLGCAQCAALYRRLEEWHERVAAVLPLPAAAEADSSLLERGVQQVVEVLADPHGELVAATSALRRQVAGLAAQAKQHAASAYYRTVDPTPLAGVRPGAAGAVLASCLAIGGGATTYCLKQGVPSLPPLRGGAETESDQPRRPRPKVRADAEVKPTVAVAVTTPEVYVPAVGQSPDTSPAQTTPVSPPPAPEDEFEPAQPSVTATAASTQQASTAPPAPSPAPGAPPAQAGGSDEFEP